MSAGVPRVAYMVRVHLGELAVYLTEFYQCPMEVADAETWLITGLTSLRPTDAPCVFYSEGLDPTVALDPRFISWARLTTPSDAYQPHYEPGGE